MAINNKTLAKPIQANEQMPILVGNSVVEHKPGVRIFSFLAATAFLGSCVGAILGFSNQNPQNNSTPVETSQPQQIMSNEEIQEILNQANSSKIDFSFIASSSEMEK